MAEEGTREYIVYLETDCTVRASSRNEAEAIAKRFVKVTTLSPLVSIDEHRRQRVVISEVKTNEHNYRGETPDSR